MTDHGETPRVANTAIGWSVVAVVAAVATAVAMFAALVRPTWSIVIPRASVIVLQAVFATLWLIAQWRMWSRLEYYRRDVEARAPGMLNAEGIDGRNWMRFDRLAALARLTRLSRIKDIPELAEQGATVRWLAVSAIVALFAYPVAYLTFALLFVFNQ